MRSFVYDSIGNVRRDSLYRVYAGTNTVAEGTYNSTTGRITSFGGCSYSTDYDGNVTQRSGCGSTVNFYWSSENRLDSLAVSGQKIRNYYDAAGRLVKRDVYGTVKYYLWNGNNLLAEIDNSGGKIAEYSYWPGGLDHLHALVVDTTVYFAHRDGFGNVVGLVNESKQLKARYTYDAWGKLVWSYDGASFGGRDRARFKGALWMGEEGPELYHLRNRWYETHSGRFLSEDPIGLAGGINLYAFARNNPISGSDPTGLHTPYKVQIPEDRSWLDGALDFPEEPEWGDLGGGGGFGPGGNGGGGGGGGVPGTPTQDPKQDPCGPILSQRPAQLLGGVLLTLRLASGLEYGGILSTGPGGELTGRQVTVYNWQLPYQHSYNIPVPVPSNWVMLMHAHTTNIRPGLADSAFIVQAGIPGGVATPDSLFHMSAQGVVIHACARP